METSIKFILITICFTMGQLKSNAQVYSPISESANCLPIVETKENPGELTVYLEQMSELPISSDSKVFRFGEIRPFGLAVGQALYKIEAKETHCEASIKIVLKPKRREANPTHVIAYLWTYELSVWDAFQNLGDTSFLNLEHFRLKATGVHDGSSIFYEYRNMNKYNTITRSVLSTGGAELVLQRYIKDLIGPMYGEECN